MLKFVAQIKAVLRGKFMAHMHTLEKRKHFKVVN